MDQWVYGKLGVFPEGMTHTLLLAIRVQADAPLRTGYFAHEIFPCCIPMNDEPTVAAPLQLKPPSLANLHVQVLYRFFIFSIQSSHDFNLLFLCVIP